MEDEILTRAVVVWTGWGTEAWPTRDDNVLKEFGPERGLDLVQAVHRLKDDLYKSDAKFTAPDLATMGDRAAEQFRVRHPEIGEDAVEALAWCYTYDYK